ncbi:nucleoside-diphosphate sugar epimerase [Lachnoclostridium sp. An169]|uniref:polysaccharide biosynthesis protein n=1 Tax=Lachnoclostridium sp. An169 TaxID=1965569 RepID=UPI000B36B224|nr:nucleoside-diphosphate sugar epimerase [Lachnoclostridium sp. An169]
MKKLINFRNSRTRMILLCLVDILTLTVHPFLAIIMRYEMHYSWVPADYLHSIRSYLIINIATTLIIFLILNLYNSIWSFAGMNELALIVIACGLSTVIQAFGMQILALSVPRSFHVFYFFLLTMTTTITRFSYKALRAIKSSWKKQSGHVYQTLVIGAGEAGSMIIQELKFSSHLNSRVVGVIDDNPSKKGKYIHGVKVLGNRDMIIPVVEKYGVDEIILAIPSASPKTTREILEICNQTSCKLKILPGMYQFITEEVNVSKLREVSIEDLLGRDPIKIDMDSVKGYIENKTILVTGGGGSIGSELCRQVAKCNPRRLIIFDIYENNAYDIQQELKHDYPHLDLVVLIGSVRNTKRIESVMESYRPDVVYHAAAHKHVPLMEDSPNEAIKNNVFGTYKTARAADKFGVRRFVLISTDKAVNPTNIMGASKRICEMVIQTFNRYSKTEYVAVRFGNVLGSNGSVIPLFKKQMAAGGPVTVTHPDIIRYFMTIPEAVSLVMQAGAYAKGGEIFILDMGKPVKIADLAKNLIRLSGYTLGVDMEIKYTGLRPGEKLYEELLTKEEGITKTDNDLIFIGKPLVFDEVHFLSELKKLEKEAADESPYVKQIVSNIVPTYHIRQEDKERDARIYKELHELGEDSQEKPVME